LHVEHALTVGFVVVERFFGVLLEHFAGAFPVWLAPEQVRVIPIAIDYNEHAQALVSRLKAHGIRATLDARNETLNYRVREGEVEKVPYMCVIGRREAEERTVALRARGAGKKQDVLTQDAFIERLLDEVRTRALPPQAEKAAEAEA
jgi:threonyl-tRNA synthetase